MDTLEELKETNRKLQNSMGKIADLMSTIEDLGQNIAVYIGHKGDKIDEYLAYYINQYPEREKMKILFVRESEGVYQFG